ncbi:MFS transporter [Telmatospirillum sp. J64-1]|uniref:MFS transporter n=1 Tax=Telmatospirillum sp. J64-1 TaxID=2502183 RepID=UPI00115CBC29|nr:MFS transporter [Telmatospirillum sp. J64-1]
MRQAIAPIAALLVAVGLMLLGSGMLGTLIGIRLADAGIPSFLNGLVMSSYFLGLVIGSLYGNRLIEAVGHIRAFSVFASVFSAATLAHGYYVAPAPWAALRMLEGVCMAGLFMVTESWLNQQADNRTRGLVLSMYMVTVYMAQGAGQFLLNLHDPSGFGLFVLASILLSVALVPVAATKVTAPATPQPSRLSFRRLYEISPLGVAGAFASGLTVGSFYGIGPIFAHEIGLPVSGTAQLMAAAIMGGLLLQFPIGRGSDLFDRRKVIVALCGGILLVSLALTQVGENITALLVLAALFGGANFTLYPLCVAHANDFIGPEDVVPVSGGLLLSYSLGATIGPLSAAAFMEAVGPSGLFLFTALVGAALGIYGLWRMTRRASPPAEEQAPFRPLPRTSLMATELDPRGTEDEEQLSFNFGS